jgi:hypothetical protein
MFGLICKCSTFELNFYEQVVNEALLVRENINVGQIFLGIPNLQDDNALSNKHNKSRIILVDIMDCQVQALHVKLGQVKEALEPTLEVPIDSALIDNDTIIGALKFLTFVLMF